MTWASTPIPGGGWEYRNDQHKATIGLTHLTPMGPLGLEAWVELRVDGFETPTAAGRIDISRADAPTPFLRQAGETEIPWAHGLREAFYSVVIADREGALIQDLADVELSDILFVLDPLVEGGANFTRLIAAGESGKSLLAMAIALTVATGSPRFLELKPQITGPVLYLDWETDPATHRRRIAALCDQAGVDEPERGSVKYMQPDGPLHRGIRRVQKAVDMYDVELLVVDSRVPAAGSSGQSSGEESTINLHAALRSIGKPAVIIDHKSKEAMAKGQRGGYGNVFNDNLARQVWEFRKLVRRGNERTFLLELTKGNNVGSLPPLGFRLVTEGGRRGITAARFTQIDPQEIIAGEEASLVDRIATLLRASSEAIDAYRISEMLGADANPRSVKTTLGSDERFENIETRKNRKGMWRMREEYRLEPTDDGVQETLDAPVTGIEDDDDTVIF